MGPFIVTLYIPIAPGPGQVAPNQVTVGLSGGFGATGKELIIKPLPMVPTKMKLSRLSKSLEGVSWFKFYDTNIVQGSPPDQNKL